MNNEGNKVLIKEIRQKLLDSSFEMENKPEGIIHFFVRDGLVQRRYEEEEINIVQEGQEKEVEKESRNGVNIKGISNLIRLVTNALSSFSRKIEYGDVIISYSVKEDGINFNAVSAKVVHHHHYPRR